MEFPSFALDVAPLPQIWQVHNFLKAFLDLRLLFKEQVAIVSRTFAEAHIVFPFRPSLDQEALLTVPHTVVAFQVDCCDVFYIGPTLKSILKLQLVQDAMTWVVVGVSQASLVTHLLCELHRLPVRFQVQCKVLVVPYEAFVAGGRWFVRLPLPGCVSFPSDLAGEASHGSHPFRMKVFAPPRGASFPPTHRGHMGPTWLFTGPRRAAHVCHWGWESKCPFGVLKLVVLVALPVYFAFCIFLEVG